MTQKISSLLLFLFFLNYTTYAQYDYGLEVIKKDVKIEGKLNIESDTNSIYIGFETGLNVINSSAKNNTLIGHQAGMNTTTASANTFLGYQAGFSNNQGPSNTFIGERSGNRNINGANNTFIGAISGVNNSGGAGNVMIGYLSGANNTVGNYNVFIGQNAGLNESGSNKLYIENARFNEPDNISPLIYGEFDNNKVQINGSLHISEFARLIPGSAPTSPEKGTMYYDSSDDKVKVWTGTWENLFFTSSTQTETSFTQRNESPCNTSCVEENQKLKIRVEQLESKLAKYDAMETKMERMEKLLNQLSGSSAINQSIEITKSARLEQNTPNPFRSATNIKYFLPLNSKNSKINIYNISGQNIKTIMLEGNGMGEIEVQIGELSKGIYHYSLEIDGQIIDTKKMSSIE